MPGYLPSDTARRLIALLKNAKELAVGRQLRTSAINVVRACKPLVDQKKFAIQPQIFDVLMDGIKDKPSLAMLDLFAQVEEAVLAEDMRSSKKNVKGPDTANQQDTSKDFIYFG